MSASYSLKYSLLGALASVGLMTGCGQTTPSDAGKAHIAAEQAMDGDQLSQAGEQLMTPYTFMLADKVFDMALSKDPNSARAGFYKALLKPAMVLQGSYRRLRPLVAANADPKAYDAMLTNVPYSPLRDFALQGGNDINTVSDF